MYVSMHCRINPNVTVQKLTGPLDNLIGYCVNIKQLNEQEEITVFFDTLPQVKAFANDIIKGCNEIAEQNSNG